MASIPSSPPAPTGPIKARLKQALPVRFHVCPWPDFYSTLDACWRDWYRWAETIVDAPAHIKSWLNQLAWQTYARQTERWLACRQSHFAPTPQPQTGLRLVVSSHLAGAQAGGRPPQEGMQTRLSVRFAPVNAPAPCPAIPYHFLHRVDKMGINYYPQNTVVEFTGQPAGYWNGIGPWEGAKVMIAWSLNDWSLKKVKSYFSMEARVRSHKVFDHWVSFRAITNPAPPATLAARSEPFSLGSLQILTSVPYNFDAPEGQRGQGWQLFIEYTHVESGQSWVVEQWLETPYGWNPVGLGGYAADQTFYQNFPDGVTEVDGTWYHRVCVYDFKRLPTAVSVLYNGMQIERGVSSITPLITMTYIPGVSPGIASVEEQVTIRTVGATKASFRILGVEPVPGFGVRFTIKVVNELHFDACIVTPFLSGISDRTSWQDNTMHFYMPTVWVVRNLGAHSESDPISIFVPMYIIETGDWPLRDLHWRISAPGEAYPAPLNQFADGIYNSIPSSPYPDIGNWPPPGYKISSDPEQYALLLAGYLENGDKVWHSSWDSTADTNRLLVTIPVRKAPGAEVPPSSSGGYDDMTFTGLFEWTAEFRVSSNPEVWEPRSGVSRKGLDLPTAIARYGRTMTLPVAAGRPMWSPYGKKWITVFESWPGGDIHELETYLVDTYLRPQFSAGLGWRNFQYTTLKPPYLTTNIAWWFESTPLNDSDGYIHVLPLIKETSTTDSVDVVLTCHR